MSEDIIPELRKRSRSLLERHTEWRTVFVLGALVLIVAAAALPAEEQPGAKLVSPCEVMASNDPLLKVLAPECP